MARREVTQFFDDLDQSPIDEGNLEVIRFSVNGKDYLIDLSKENAAKFHEMMAPYIEAGHKAPKVESRSKVNSRDVRTWAYAHGIEVARRGKISQDVIDAYQQAMAATAGRRS